MDEAPATERSVDVLRMNRGSAVTAGGMPTIAGEVRIRLELCPISFEDACAFVERFHRHHEPPTGHKFSVGVASGQTIVGVAIVGRPVARLSNDGWTMEVTRLCTDGTANAPSMLYGACRRAAWAMGYRRLITYTLPSEGGASLRASGFRLIGERGGGSWSRPSRPRVDDHPLERKWLWESP